MAYQATIKHYESCSAAKKRTLAASQAHSGLDPIGRTPRSPLKSLPRTALNFVWGSTPRESGCDGASGLAVATGTFISINTSAWGASFCYFLITPIVAGLLVGSDLPPFVVPLLMLDQTPRPAAEMAQKQTNWVVLPPVPGVCIQASCAA